MFNLRRPLADPQVFTNEEVFILNLIEFRLIFRSIQTLNESLAGSNKFRRQKFHLLDMISFNQSFAFMEGNSALSNYFHLSRDTFQTLLD